MGTGAVDGDGGARNAIAHMVWDQNSGLQALCRKHGTKLKAAAVQFCMAHPAVTVALLGARTAAEVSDNIAMTGRPVPSEFWRELRERKLVDAAAPLPGGV